MFTIRDGKKEELYKCLLKKIQELGRKPSFMEMKLDENMPDPNAYAYWFGSFSQAAEEAWKGYNYHNKHSTNIKKPVKSDKPG